MRRIVTVLLLVVSLGMAAQAYDEALLTRSLILMEESVRNNESEAANQSEDWDSND